MVTQEENSPEYITTFKYCDAYKSIYLDIKFKNDTNTIELTLNINTYVSYLNGSSEKMLSVEYIINKNMMYGDIMKGN